MKSSNPNWFSDSRHRKVQKNESEKKKEQKSDVCAGTAFSLADAFGLSHSACSQTRNSEEQTQVSVSTSSPRSASANCSRLERGVFQSLETTRPTATFAPLHYEPNYAYPLIVWLHGPGESERQLLRVMPMMSLRNYVAAAVRGGVSFGKDGLPRDGFYWDPGTYETTFTSVLEAIESIRQKYRIASNRIYLAGCEEGGTMAQRLAFRNPGCFNGVISFDGAVPEDVLLLEHFREVRNVRFLYAVSRASRTCPAETLCDHLRILYGAGVPLTLRNYPTMGSLQIEMLQDANRWVMGGIESALL